ncbi:hypothetical protein [Leucobacter sp. G161]|uniref:hypothetical protein n=1 Tax=Leucobacter sp. G161 TaxID=663704 RepID=UPI00073BA71C|nr:hypothetical protein [Leucobacter sp. G161]KUF06860.1 hypothetical protein AUL38_10765 [Leucobacter sp. G161]
MTEAVIWLVVWVILTGAGMWVAVALGTLLGAGIAAALDSVWPVPAFVFIGWLGAIAWLVFGAVHVVLQIIDVVQRVIA